MKKINYIFLVLVGLLFILGSCQKDQYEMGDLVAPSNVKLAYQIVGADDANPYGDGTGMVNFTATADNEITYRFNFDDGFDTVTANGKSLHRFSISGINTYNVTVFAVGAGGISSSNTTQITVSSEFEDVEAGLFLTGGSTKTWYWAADQVGHLGLGPNDQVYENGDQTYDAWYAAAPWEKAESSLYQTELVFSNETGKLTFEQINPTGEAFIQGLYAAELGLGDEGSHPFDIAGVKTVQFSPSASIATVPGGYRGTTMTFSGGGFMGFYAGTSQYEIIEVTENILKVRIQQANEPLFAWYHIFTNVKPVQ